MPQLPSPISTPGGGGGTCWWEVPVSCFLPRIHHWGKSFSKEPKQKLGWKRGHGRISL